MSPEKSKEDVSSKADLLARLLYLSACVFLVAFLLGSCAFDLSGKNPEIRVQQGSRVLRVNDSYDFGTVTAGSFRDAEFLIENTGEADLILTAPAPASISGPDAALFTVVLQPKNDTPLAPGDITSMVVRFAPAALGANYSAVLTIAHDAPDNAPFVFGLSGDARAATAVSIQMSGPAVTTETGGTAVFTVTMLVPITHDATLPLSSGDPSEAMVSPSSIIFTPEDWATPQTVLVTGLDDDEDDGDVGYAVALDLIVSDDEAVANVNPDDILLTNENDDTAGISVQLTGDPLTSESVIGRTTTIQVVLDSRPLADVAIAVSSTDTGEGIVSTPLLTFTRSNWNIAQIVTVTGVDDPTGDGNQAYQVVLGAASSDDPKYAGVDPADLDLTNVDDDSVGITLNRTSGLHTTEAGGADSFTIRLNTQPIDVVTLSLSVSDSTEGSVSPSSLTFTTSTWSTPQTVTVTGVNDDLDDNDIGYTVLVGDAMSADPDYSGLAVPDPAATNADDDAWGFVVTPTDGLVTSEAGGTAAFTVTLTSEPTSNVTIALSSNDTSEGTVSPSSLSFTPGGTTDRWSTPHTVTVTGVDDFVDDGDIGFYAITGNSFSADPRYSNSSITDVSVINTDNDTFGINVAPTADLVTTEAGGTAAFTVVLSSEPTSDVVISISSSDTTEGTVSPSSLTFTPGGTTDKWSTPHTVTVTGIDDFVDDGNIGFSVITGNSLSSDSHYSNCSITDVSVINTDNDTVGINVSPTSGLVTTEAGGTASFTVVLSSEPTANVTIALSSNNTLEGAVSPSSLTFTPGGTTDKWSTPHTVTVTGVDEYYDDGNIAYTVVLNEATSSDPLYDVINPSDVSVANTDDDTAGYVVSRLSGLVTTEAGAHDHFNVRLQSRPLATVTVNLAVPDSSEATFSPSSLTFNNTTWSTDQEVTVTGVDDAVDDGDVVHSINLSNASSSDPKYSGNFGCAVTATNADDDTAGLVLSGFAGRIIEGESGQNTITVNIHLASQPIADVIISVTNTMSWRLDASPSTLTLTPSDWSDDHSVTLTAVDDGSHDMDDFVYVQFEPSGSDPVYDALSSQTGGIMVWDNDTNGYDLVRPFGPLVTTENSVDEITLRLTSRPSGPVFVTFSSSDENRGSPVTLVLLWNPSEWYMEKTIEIQGGSDADPSGLPYWINGTASGGGYNGCNTPPVMGFNYPIE